MARTESTMLELGTAAPDFTLPDPDGKVHALSDFAGAKALLVIFMCNHCPFVKLVREELAAIGRDYLPRGLAMVGINANDVANYPDDSPEKMAIEAAEAGYTFPYLYDETQQVAAAYRAACTPDFFLFDAGQRLAYRGQLDDARPGNGVTPDGRDLRAAIEALLDGQAVPAAGQKPSIGCNIKWKAGNAPDYYAA